jgi:hypothetical protein
MNHEKVEQYFQGKNKTVPNLRSLLGYAQYLEEKGEIKKTRDVYEKIYIVRKLDCSLSLTYWKSRVNFERKNGNETELIKIIKIFEKISIDRKEKEIFLNEINLFLKNIQNINKTEEGMNISKLENQKTIPKVVSIKENMNNIEKSFKKIIKTEEGLKISKLENQKTIPKVCQEKRNDIIGLSKKNEKSVKTKVPLMKVELKKTGIKSISINKEEKKPKENKIMEIKSSRINKTTSNKIKDKINLKETSQIKGYSIKDKIISKNVLNKEKLIENKNLSIKVLKNVKNILNEKEKKKTILNQTEKRKENILIEKKISNDEIIETPKKTILKDSITPRSSVKKSVSFNQRIQIYEENKLFNNEDDERLKNNPFYNDSIDLKDSFLNFNKKFNINNKNNDLNNYMNNTINDMNNNNNNMNNTITNDKKNDMNNINYEDKTNKLEEDLFDKKEYNIIDSVEKGKMKVDMNWKSLKEDVKNQKKEFDMINEKLKEIESLYFNNLPNKLTFDLSDVKSTKDIKLEGSIDCFLPRLTQDDTDDTKFNIVFTPTRRSSRNFSKKNNVIFSKEDTNKLILFQ